MDMTTFFAYARRAPFGGRLSQSQIDGINAIFRQWNACKLTDHRHLANILAQVFRETGGRMVPVRETFATTDNGAINALEKAFAAGKLGSVKTPYWRKDKNGKSWFGRGGIQITHETNYAKLGKRLGVDLVGNPSLALDLEISAKIAVIGMSEGLFTGKKLSDFFSDTVDNPLGARGIVNGTDKAKLIAGYHRSFLDALNAALAAAQLSVPATDIKPEEAKADNVPVAKSKSLWTIASAIVASGGLGAAKEIADSGASFFSAMSNPWAFGSLAMTLVVLALGGWLVGSGRITINRGGVAQ